MNFSSMLASSRSLKIANGPVGAAGLEKGQGERPGRLTWVFRQRRILKVVDVLRYDFSEEEIVN